MSDAIKRRQCWPRLPVAQVRAEVCLDSVLAAQSGVCIALEMPFSPASRLAQHIPRASLVSIPCQRRHFLALFSNTVTFQNT